MHWPSGENAADVPGFEYPVNGPASVTPVMEFHTRNDCAMLNRALSRNGLGGLKRHVLQGVKILIPLHRRPLLEMLDVFFFSA